MMVDIISKHIKITKVRVLFNLFGLGGSVSSASPLYALLVDTELMFALVYIFSRVRLYIGGHIGDHSKSLGSLAAAAAVITSIFLYVLLTGTVMIMFLGWLIKPLLL